MSYILNMQNYKATKARRIVFEQGLTCLSSFNGGGKSSIVEAIGVCLGLDKKEDLDVPSLKDLVNHDGDLCAVSLTVESPGKATQKMEVEIRRTPEEDDEDEKDEEEEEQGAMDDEEDQEQKLIKRFVNGTIASKKDFLGAARPLGTNSLGTVMCVVNHETINPSPSTNQKLTDYMKKMSGAAAHCQTPAYKKAKKAVRMVEIHRRNLAAMEATLSRNDRNAVTMQKEISYARMRVVLANKKERAEKIIREAHEAREAALLRFVTDVSARMNGFVRLYYKDRDIRTSLEVKESGKIVLAVKDGGERAHAADMNSISGGEKRVIQLALSFSILHQYNVPLALVDNADHSFFRENGIKLLQFCDLILENSETMKTIVLIGNDEDNFFRFAKDQGYNVVTL